MKKMNYFWFHASSLSYALLPAKQESIITNFAVKASDNFIGLIDPSTCIA